MRTLLFLLAIFAVTAGVGTPGAFDHKEFEVFAGVAEVIRISSPYKLAGRSFRPEGTVVRFPNGVSVGGEQVVVANTLRGPIDDRRVHCGVRAGNETHPGRAERRAPLSRRFFQSRWIVIPLAAFGSLLTPR